MAKRPGSGDKLARSLQPPTKREREARAEIEAVRMRQSSARRI